MALGTSLASLYQEQTGQQETQYKQALGRFNKRFGTMTSQFGQGIAGLQESADFYQPGGEFTTSQYKQLEQGTKTGLAEAAMNLSQTGMWSGTNMAGLRTSAYQQEGISKSNLEAERIANLTNLNAAIASLRAQYGQTAVSAQEPAYGEFYNQGFGAYIGAKANTSNTQFSALAQLAAQKQQQTADIELEKLKQSSNSGKATTH